MPSKESHSYTPVLNQWQGPVGDEAIRAVIDVARERIPDGSALASRTRVRSFSISGIRAVSQRELASAAPG